MYLLFVGALRTRSKEYPAHFRLITVLGMPNHRNAFRRDVPKPMLMFRGLRLHDGQTLKECNIPTDSQLVLLDSEVRLCHALRTAPHPPIITTTPTFPSRVCILYIYEVYISKYIGRVGVGLASIGKCAVKNHVNRCVS